MTTGQDSAVTLTEGRLPPRLAAQALTAANDVVAGNCVGSDRKVIKAGDGGSFWPSGVAPLAGGVFVCVKVASAGTAVPTAVVDNALVTSPNNTSVQTPSVRPPVAASVAPASPIPGGSRVGPAYSPSVTPGDSSDVPVLTPDVSTPDSAGAATEAAAAPTTKAAELAGVSLALPLPDDGRNGLDRLTTMLLGGVAFVIVRSIFRRTRVVA